MYPLNKSTMVAIGIVVICGLILLGSCGKAPSESASDQTQGTKNDAAANTANATDAADAPDTTPPLCTQAFTQLKDMWSLQIEGMAAQAETLRKLVAQYPDAEFDGIVKKMEAKVADTRKLFGTATPANGSKLYQVDIPKMVGEAAELAGKANEHMTVVVKAASGG